MTMVALRKEALRLGVESKGDRASIERRVKE